MISEKQLAANRRNARRSTGPKTAEGKDRSSRNNLRHGLTGQITVLPSEDREAHDLFCNRLLEWLNPENPMEEQLANSIAEDSWRLNRVSAIETNIFALGRRYDNGAHERRELQCALKDAETFLDEARNFQLLTLYEQRINRNLQRSLKQLRQLQAERREQEQARLAEEKAERERQMEEAKLIARQSTMNSQTADLKASDPRANGFEFSTTEICYSGNLKHAPEPPSAAENHPTQALSRLARAA
jgi:hypothetical protein